MEQQFLIKGMVCDRCIRFISDEANRLKLPLQSISLGKLVFSKLLTSTDQIKFINFLTENGFESMSHRHERTIREVKKLVNEFLEESSNNRKKTKLSVNISEALHLNYDSVSELFSAIEGITLEKYVITKRIEKVIELLMYTDLSLTEISHQLDFSSINHLSKQFKEIVGLAPSHYRLLKKEKEKISAES
jgi:AraC-like DNA-binding protein